MDERLPDSPDVPGQPTAMRPRSQTDLNGSGCRTGIYGLEGGRGGRKVEESWLGSGPGMAR